MAKWIPICDFPAQEDLSELAQFIQHHQLPLRIIETDGTQRLISLSEPLVEPMRELLARWRKGEVQLDQIAPEREAQTGNISPHSGQQHTASKTQEASKPPSLSTWPWRATPFSLVLIALCFIGWLLVRQGWVGPLVIYPERGNTFDLASSTLAQHWLQGEYWRLWTPAILHFSLPHALFNALWIWVLGRPLEARAGTLAFATLVLVSAAIANLSQYYWTPQIMFGGMSGVTYALVGAVAVIQRWQPQWTEIPTALIWLAVIWLLLCATGAVDYVISGGIANAAHLGGFICGIVLGLVYCLSGGAKKFSGVP